MKREDLKALGLTDEQIEKVMAENGKDIEKHKADAETNKTEAAGLKSQLEAANGTIAERNKQLDELKKVDPAALQAKITELQTANTEAETKHAEQLKQLKMDSAIENGLIKAGAVNTKAVKALLDAGKISLDGDNVLGLDDQIKALRETEKWAFAAQTAPKSGDRHGTSGTSGEGATLQDEIMAKLEGKTE